MVSRGHSSSGVCILFWTDASSARGKKFGLVATNYFTKWIEAKQLGRIGEDEAVRLIWRNIVCLFSLPKDIVIDNGKQFYGHKIKEFTTNYGIKLRHSFPN